MAPKTLLSLIQRGFPLLEEGVHSLLTLGADMRILAITSAVYGPLSSKVRLGDFAHEILGYGQSFRARS